MTCFVYVLGCADHHGIRTYVGWTNDIAKRVKRHNGGVGARSTRGRSWMLLYVEWHGDRRAAMSREWYLKHDRRFRKRLSHGLTFSSPVF